MHKAVIPALLLLLVMPLASAVSIKTGVQGLFDNLPSVVIGDSQNADDNLAAIVFQNALGIKTTTKASAADKTETLVIIGGPCANSAWTSFSDETCDSWNQPEGKALIISQDVADKHIILIGGTSGKDTRAAAKFVMDNFADAQFNKDRVILNTEGLPLPKDTLKVYKEAGAVSEGQSSASADVIIEVPNNAAGGTMDYAKGLEKYILAGYPRATIQILEQDEVNLNIIDNHVFIMLQASPIISVDTDQDTGSVVIAAAAAIWLGGQGMTVQDMTHNQLVESDLKFE